MWRGGSYWWQSMRSDGRFLTDCGSSSSRLPPFPHRRSQRFGCRLPRKQERRLLAARTRPPHVPEAHLPALQRPSQFMASLFGTVLMEKGKCRHVTPAGLFAFTAPVIAFRLRCGAEAALPGMLKDYIDLVPHEGTGGGKTAHNGRTRDGLQPNTPARATVTQHPPYHDAQHTGNNDVFSWGISR